MRTVITDSHISDTRGIARVPSENTAKNSGPMKRPTTSRSIWPEILPTAAESPSGIA